MKTETTFNQKEYWVHRHIDLQGDPRSVGNLAASVEDNVKGEQELKAYMQATAQVLKGTCSTVLDLGCGYGRISQCFTDLGFAYTGYDLSATAIQQASSQNGKGVFKLVDLLHWTPTEKFDVVCLLFVLVHFVRDEDWLKFFRAAMASVADGGYLLLADQFPTGERKSANHYVARPFKEYLPSLQEGGFLVDENPAGKVARLVPGNSNTRYVRFVRRKV
jgi:SAM-dependent methyltransferase